MNSIENQDKLQNILKYGKYAVLLMLIVGGFLLFRSCGRTYNDIEEELIEEAKKYVHNNNITISDEKYVEITKLNEVEGTELCSRASGVSIKSVNGKLKYTVYLECMDYKSNTTNEKSKYIVLNGGSVITLNAGEVFNDPLYTLKKEADVIISGKVLTLPGIYTVSYMAYVDNELKETVYRKVIVSENDKDQNISGLKNTEDPVITLIGDKNIVLSLGTRYKEEGYLAVDYEDGKISRRVEVLPNPASLPANKPGGPYTITYQVTNSKGKVAIAIRQITYVKEKADLDIQLSIPDNKIAKTTVITGTVIGEGYNVVEMPDGSQIPDRNFSYTATTNKTYTFTVSDIYNSGDGTNNKFIKEIEVTNIDNISPIGTCTALVRGNNTEIEVSASDNKGIAGYSYVLDEKESDYIYDNTYKVNSASKKVSVNVKDIADNVAKIDCEVTIKQTTTVSGKPNTGSATTVDTSTYTLVNTRNDALQFAKAVERQKVAQNNTEDGPFNDLCLSFAYYHAYKLYNGDSLSSLSALEASKYTYAAKFKKFNSDDKQLVLAQVYESINAGQPCILHVNGNKEGTSRHYVAVIGYKSSVTSGSTITEEDLLIIDSHDGNLERMDTSTSRFMITGYDTGRKGDKAYGYQAYIFR